MLTFIQAIVLKYLFLKARKLYVILRFNTVIE